MIDRLIQFRPVRVAERGNLAVTCRRFLQHLHAHGYAQNTLNAYRRDLEQFAGFCAGRGIEGLGSITGAIIDGFITALVRGEGVSPRTAARKLATARELFRWAVRQGITANNPAEQASPVRFVAEKKQAPSTERIVELLEAIPAETALDIRDRAMFWLMYDAGLRCDGLASLDLFDPSEPPRHTVTPAGDVRYRSKGGATKHTVCGERALELIEQWRAVRPRLAEDCPALFVTRRGSRMTRVSLDGAIKRHGARVGLPAIHCHLLRHRRAREVIEGLGLREASEFLGHANTSTTADVYGYDGERTREQVRRHCPAGRVRSCS